MKKIKISWQVIKFICQLMVAFGLKKTQKIKTTIKIMKILAQIIWAKHPDYS